MLSSTHATVMSSLQPRGVRAYECIHLNGSDMAAAAFDPQRSFRAYGLNGRGELLTLVTPHEGRINICKVRHRGGALALGLGLGRWAWA